MLQVEELNVGTGIDLEGDNLYDYDNRKNAAWRIQHDSQKQVLDHIRKASRMTGHKNIVVSGGYGLNCMANYYYLDQLKDEGIYVYIEPVSNDGGTALGAALLQYHIDTKDDRQRERITHLYTGTEHTYDLEDFEMQVE